MDAADATTILGAGKITGRTANGISVGLMDAVTNRERATFRPTGSTIDETQEVEPLANYFVGRLRKDFNGGNTRIGEITTLVNRALSNPDEIQRLRTNAQAVGLDLDHHWSNRAYSFNVQLFAAHSSPAPATTRDLGGPRQPTVCSALSLIQTAEICTATVSMPG
jgi:hypothetical protein